MHGNDYRDRANVSAITRELNVLGYLSLRCQPAESELRHTRQVYRDLTPGQASLLPGLLIALMTAGLTESGAAWLLGLATLGVASALLLAKRTSTPIAAVIEQAKETARRTAGGGSWLQMPSDGDAERPVCSVSSTSPATNRVRASVRWASRLSSSVTQRNRMPNG